MNQGLNKMNKSELRAKLNADAEKWMRKHGEVRRIAAPLPPLEHHLLCGQKYKRKVLKERDARQEAYLEWLESEKRRAALV